MKITHIWVNTINNLVISFKCVHLSYGKINLSEFNPILDHFLVVWQTLKAFLRGFDYF